MKKNKPREITNTTSILSPFLMLVQWLVALCFIALLVGVFGNSMGNFWEQPQPMSAEDYAKFQKKRAAQEGDWDKVENGIHVETGLVYAEGFEEVRGTCTACHSAKLVIQNRATRAGWKDMIRWMQQTQGLWDLGSSEPIILDYLAKHYAPQAIERRASLDVEEIEWYIIRLYE